MNIKEEMRPTIESRAGEFVTKQRRRMYAGEERVYPIVPLRDLDILDLPRLETGAPARQRFLEDLRFGYVNGEIYTTHWQDVELSVDPTTGRRSIKNPEDYAIISSQAGSADPEDLPKSGKVKRLVVGRVWDGLESAIRQQYHVLKSYDPAALDAEPQRLRGIIHWVNQTSLELKEGGVTRGQLVRLSGDVAALIARVEHPTVQNEIKQKMIRMLENAAKTDRRGRVNPMISRIRLRSALLGATQRLTVSEMVTQKFSANLGVLIAEREFTRYNLKQAYNELGEIQWHLGLDGISDYERQELASGVKEVALQYLRFPRVAPYLIPARLSAVFLVGSRDEKKDLNRQVLGEETAEAVYAIPHAKELLEKGELFYAGRRISWARSILNDALTKPEHNNLRET